MSTLDNFLYFLPILTIAVGVFSMIIYAEHQDRKARKFRKVHK